MTTCSFNIEPQSLSRPLQETLHRSDGHGVHAISPGLGRRCKISIAGQAYPNISHYHYWHVRRIPRVKGYLWGCGCAVQTLLCNDTNASSSIVSAPDVIQSSWQLPLWLHQHDFHLNDTRPVYSQPPGLLKDTEKRQYTSISSMCSSISLSPASCLQSSKPLQTTTKQTTCDGMLKL